MNDKLKHFIACGVILLITLSGIAQIPYDKKLHAGAGVVAGVWGTFAGNSMMWKPEKAALFGIGSVAVAGIGKELLDQSEHWFFDKEHYFDVKDLGATMIGGVVGVGLTYTGLKIFYHYKPQIFIDNVQSNSTIGIKINF